MDFRVYAYNSNGCNYYTIGNRGPFYITILISLLLILCHFLFSNKNNISLFNMFNPQKSMTNLISNATTPKKIVVFDLDETLGSFGEISIFWDALEHFYEPILLGGDWYEVGSGITRGFEDKLEIMNIPYKYHPEKLIPKGYQFYTCSNKEEWMAGWKPRYNLEDGLKDYLTYLDA